MQEKEFSPVPGYYPLTVSRDGVFRNSITGKIYTPSKIVTRTGRVAWHVTLMSVCNGVKKTRTVTVYRAWAMCYMPQIECDTLKVALRDSPIEYKDAIDPSNIVWVRTYCGKEVNTVLDDGTEVMAMTNTSKLVKVPQSTLYDHFRAKGFSDAGTQPVYLV